MPVVHIQKFNGTAPPQLLVTTDLPIVCMELIFWQAGRRRDMRAALRHHYDVIRSRDLIGHVTIRLRIDVGPL